MLRLFRSPPPTSIAVSKDVKEFVGNSVLNEYAIDSIYKMPATGWIVGIGKNKNTEVNTLVIYDPNTHDLMTKAPFSGRGGMIGTPDGTRLICGSSGNRFIIVTFPQGPKGLTLTLSPEIEECLYQGARLEERDFEATKTLADFKHAVMLTPNSILFPTSQSGLESRSSLHLMTLLPEKILTRSVAKGDFTYLLNLNNDIVIANDMRLALLKDISQNPSQQKVTPTNTKVFNKRSGIGISHWTDTKIINAYTDKEKINSYLDINEVTRSSFRELKKFKLENVRLSGIVYWDNMLVGYTKGTRDYYVMPVFDRANHIGTATKFEAASAIQDMACDAESLVLATDKGIEWVNHPMLMNAITSSLGENLNLINPLVDIVLGYYNHRR